MVQWLKIFAVIFTLLAVCSGMGAAGGAFAFLLFACNKNLYLYDLGEGVTVASMFEELGVGSRAELLGVLGATVISSALSFVMYLFLTKWFSKANKTGEPFSTDLVKKLRSVAKYMLIACVVGFIIDTVIESAVDIVLSSSSYSTMLAGGLFAMCASYVLAYANVCRKTDEPEPQTSPAEAAIPVEQPTTPTSEPEPVAPVVAPQVGADKTEIVEPVEQPEVKQPKPRSTKSTAAKSTAAKKSSSTSGGKSGTTKAATKSSTKSSAKPAESAKKASAKSVDKQPIAENKKTTKSSKGTVEAKKSTKTSTRSKKASTENKSAE